MPRQSPPPRGLLTERDFQATVEDLAARLGWHIFHVAQSTIQLADGTRIGDKKAKGFPDLVLVRERIIYRELKLDRSYLDQAQKAWQQWLEDAGADVGVWRPHQFDSVIAPTLAKYAQAPRRINLQGVPHQ